jgi:hypothetical protein
VAGDWKPQRTSRILGNAMAGKTVIVFQKKAFPKKEKEFPSEINCNVIFYKFSLRIALIT